MDSDYSISLIAETLVEEHEKLAARLGIGRMDVAMALACACGAILAADPKMSRERALAWMDELRAIMQTAYELHGKRATSGAVRLADLEEIMGRFDRLPSRKEAKLRRQDTAVRSDCGQDGD